MLATEDLILRLVVAALLGGIVGLERERMEWAAGLRTHMLVSLGSALIMLVSIYGFVEISGSVSQTVTLDPSRLAAQVVSGIGFLGAGTILFYKQEVIRGLTTAASLWTVAGIGLAVGTGMFMASIFTTLLVVIILGLIKPLERRFFRKNLHKQLTIKVDANEISLIAIQQAIEAGGLLIKEMTITKGQYDESLIYFSFLRSMSDKALESTIKNLQEIKGVYSLTLQNKS